MTTLVDSGDVLAALRAASAAYFHTRNVTVADPVQTVEFDIIEFYGILTLEGPDTIENFTAV